MRNAFFNLLGGIAAADVQKFRGDRPVLE